ncbi:MAG TPA: tetratricopeptide repeat protein [Thermoanaerobaculia bacterium]
MSNYPGNLSLASAVKEKVNSTFLQTLELYRRGSTEDVIAGCTLILQMDPLYDPAKKLLEKIRNPASRVDVATLMPGPSADESLGEARAAMASRDFERVIQITSGILTNDLMNEDARVLADEAREKIEAGPFIDQFVRRCEQSINNGNLAAARGDLEKARALDASHPGIARIEKMIAAKEAAPPGAPAAPAAPAAASSTFVVETPAGPTGRSTAQASDFGFTFEEDKPADNKPSSFANFSFDTPAAPSGTSPFSSGFSFDTPAANPSATPGFSFDAPAKGSGSEFDFSTASIETSPDDQKKIDQYLADGDKAFETGNYQNAIDLWSRIFLIDVTNEAASDRIERAKAKRREIEQHIETTLAAAIQAFERKDFASARAGLTDVLKSDPTNVMAQDYMERLKGVTAPPAPVFTPPAEPAYPKSVLEDDIPEGDIYAGPIIEPATSSRAPSVARPAPRPVETGRRPLALIAAVIAVVVIAGGWFVWSKFISQPKTDPAAARALLDKATEYSQQGKYDLAISTLQDIKPGDAQYDKALVMIADVQQKKARASQLIDGRPAGAFYDENMNAGRTAFAAHDYVTAKKNFEQAMRVKPLPPDVKPSYDIAAQQVSKLDNARTLFAERKYLDAITSLQSLQQQDPQNPNIQRMIVDAHFNLGATALQDERLSDAKREFDEVLKADPNDELARRSKDLADRYDGQPKDLLYKIYVKYLPLRHPAA